MNHLLIARYEQLLGELYLEPEDEGIMGTFLSVICENDFVGTNQWTPCEASSSTKNKKKADVQSRDIFETCLERKTNDVIQLQPIRFWKYIRGVLKVVFFILSTWWTLLFWRVLIFANFNCKKISWVLLFANLTSINISRVFNFAKRAKKCKIREKMYPWNSYS